MSIQACADIVAAGDPDRFAATMACPPDARARLFPIYALNVEVARAPWVTQESMIAEMRLQWWRDALEEIIDGQTIRRHEVTTPLAETLDPEGAKLLDKVVQARRWDIYDDPFEDAGHFQEYLNATGGELMWAAARSLGEMDAPSYRTLGAASALANLFLAVPALQARGKAPLVDSSPDAIADLAKNALSNLPSLHGPATLPAWRTGTILRRAARRPQTVLDGTLRESEFQRRVTLLWASLRS